MTSSKIVHHEILLMLLYINGRTKTKTWKLSLIINIWNREKPLRHVAMVAKFLDDNKLKK